MRAEWARYLNSVSGMDLRFGRVLERLRADGLEDDTIILFFGDNGRLEPRDWNVLLDAHAALHDILVANGAQGRGVGRALLDAFVAAVRARGAPRVVLHTAVANERAQRLFRELGFRPTMLEMTLDLPA